MIYPLDSVIQPLNNRGLVCKNQHTREALDITGLLDVTVAVSYDGAHGSSLTLPDYQCKRIKSKTKSDTNGSTKGIIGYLFRFHEPVTKYKVSFCLNAVIPPKRKGKRKSVKPEHTAWETICQISVTLETGPKISSKSGKTKEKAIESTVSPLFALSPFLKSVLWCTTNPGGLWITFGHGVPTLSGKILISTQAIYCWRSLMPTPK